jgi:sugar phosphate isomerase/epimerase
MLPKLGFSLQANYDLPMAQVIPMVKQAGFSALSPVWTSEAELEAIADCAKQNSMALQSLHAPRKNIPFLWTPDTPQSSEILESILCCIDGCNRFQIPITVIHSWQGLNYTFPDTPLDFQAFDRIVAYARQKQVSIAFENLEGEEYLDALMTRYRDQAHVGFCWDSGHDRCHPHRMDFLKAFGGRLIMTHLNDNFGIRDPAGVPAKIDDLHFLPYDGNTDWDNVISRLKSAAKQATLNFEFKIRSHSTDPRDLPYVQLSLEDFLGEAGRRARKIARMYAEIM